VKKKILKRKKDGESRGKKMSLISLRKREYEEI